MSSENTTSESTVMEVAVKDFLQRTGYDIEAEAKAREWQMDFIAKRGSKRYGIEVKTTIEGILNGIWQLAEKRILPEFDLLYVAAPKEIISEDIKKIAENPKIGIGILSILPDGSIEETVDSKEKSPAKLVPTGYSYGNLIVPGESFELSVNFSNQGGKIVENVKVNSFSIGPFHPKVQKEQQIRSILPKEQKSVIFKIAVEKEATIGDYHVFVSWNDGKIADSRLIEVRIEGKSEDYLEHLVANSIAELNEVSSTNVEDFIRNIDEAVEKGTIDITKHIYDKSIWNSMAIPYLEEGMLKQAKQIYTSMVNTLENYEKNHKPIHKGLAYHNLGVVLYRLGDFKEAEMLFLKAIEEDKRTYGEKAALEGQACKALAQLKSEKKS